MSSFLSRAPVHHSSFTFNLRSLYELKHKVCLTKTVCRIFRFRFRFVFIKRLHFCSIKCMASLTLKRHNSFQNQNNRKATQRFAPKPLILKLQQEVLKCNDICVSWSSPKNGLVINLLKAHSQL